jgi:hypothetical protein
MIDALGVLPRTAAIFSALEKPGHRHSHEFSVISLQSIPSRVHKDPSGVPLTGIEHA